MPLPARFLLAAPLVLLLLLSRPTPTSAADVRPLNLQVMTQKAGKILDVTCTESRVERDAKTNIIVTVTTFQVQDALKNGATKQFEVRQFGGIFPDGSGTLVEGMPSYTPGERSIVFLYPVSSLGLTSPVGGIQGKFQVFAAENGSGLCVVNSLSNEKLFRGMDAKQLVRRDARGQVLPEDRPILRALRSGSDGAPLDDFKALVRRLMKSGANTSTSSTNPTPEMGGNR